MAEKTPEKYRSPDTHNVYSVIGFRPSDTAEIGLSLEAERGTLVMRFAVFADSDPGMKNFSPRYGTKYFARTETDSSIKRLGQSLNKIDVPVFKNPKASATAIDQRLSSDDGWDKLGTWVGEQLQAEGFEVLYALHEVMPEILKGSMGIASDRDIGYPIGPLSKPKKAAVAKTATHSADGEFDEDEGGDDE